MQQNDYEVVRSWETFSRFAVLGLLVLSAFQFLSVAVVLGTLGESEGDKLLAAMSLVLAGTATALAIAYRKSGAPTSSRRCSTTCCVAISPPVCSWE